jgi:queuine tRNA-ribosyltransferase
VKAGEIISSMLLTWHNLTFYQDLMAELRTAIAEARADDFANIFLQAYRGGDA